MIRERCSCGAEFETDEKSALQLLKSWRAIHRHEISDSATFVNTNSQVEQATQAIMKEPELQIGFRPEGE
jgi:hypothetical protein